MRLTRLTSNTLCGLLLAAACGIASAHDHAAMMAAQAAAPKAATLPGESLHRLGVMLTDQRGKRFTLGDEPAPATLVSMFYGDCRISCPIVLENAKRSLEALSAAQRQNTRVVLISLDPARDSSASLAKLARTHALPAGMRLAVAGNEAATRQMAAALGVKYRRTADGEINHSTRFLVLDQQGRIAATSDRLAVEPDPALLQKIGEQLASAGHD